MNMWRDNGTKIMGYSAAAVGTVTAGIMALDPALVTAVVGPKYGAYFALAMAIFGGAVAKRGHTNTANIEAQKLDPPIQMPTSTTNVGRAP